jgi:hypothetical protein
VSTIDLEAEARRVERLEAGGFRIRTPQDGEIVAEPAADVWSVRLPASKTDWTLRRSDSTQGGFVLLAEDGQTEVGRTARLDGLGFPANLYYLLLGDGRLFRIALCGPRESGFELLGWETPGAYLIARPDAAGWTLTPTPASYGLPDLRALLILFAAEILESEMPIEGCAEPVPAGT